MAASPPLCLADEKTRKNVSDKADRDLEPSVGGASSTMSPRFCCACYLLTSDNKKCVDCILQKAEVKLGFGNLLFMGLVRSHHFPKLYKFE